MEFLVFLENLMRFGLEYFRVYPGVYRAQVTRNDDPQTRGRIQIMCPEVGHRDTNPPDVWVDPAFPNAGAGHGMFWPPEVGDSVRVSFEAGQASRPVIYWGGWYGRDEVPTELGHGADNLPTIRGFKTPGGHVLQFSDEPGSEAVRLLFKSGESGAEATIAIEPDKSIRIDNGQGRVLVNADGSIAIDDGAGNKIDLSSEGVVLSSGVVIKAGSGATSPAMKFSEWVAWAATHTHGTGTGPSTPPVPLPPGGIASSKVLVE